MARDLDPAHVREPDVEQDDIRLEALGGLEGGLAVLGLGDHIPARDREAARGAAPEAGVVIDDQDSACHGVDRFPQRPPTQQGKHPSRGWRKTEPLSLRPWPLAPSLSIGAIAASSELPRAATPPGSWPSTWRGPRASVCAERCRWNARWASARHPRES